MADNYRRFSRNPQIFNKSGRMRPGVITRTMPQESLKEDPSKEDRKNRQNVLKEIEKRCKQGEDLNTVVAEIAGREEVKQQFDYYIKNGIADLAEIFKNWYQSYIKNQGRDKFYPGGIR